MIKILLDDYELDLSKSGVNLVEKNNMFRDAITKSYSFPFPLILNDELGVKLGIADIKNISSYKTKTDVKVIEHDRYYEGYLKISKIIGKTANATLYYGHETLAVYDMFLNTLPFEKVNKNAINFAAAQIGKHWPDATHNFITVKDEEFVKKSEYSYFEGYLNNTLAGNFIQNTNVLNEDEVLVHANKNVLVPMPYLMEILKVGFSVENKIIKGTFVDDVFNHKILHLPEEYLEQFSSSDLDVSSFSTPNLNIIIDGVIYSNYTKSYATNFNGTYKFYFNFDFTAETASYFKLIVKHGDIVLYEVNSVDEAIHIRETLTLNIDADNLNFGLTLELVLKEQTTSLAALNFLKFEFEETKLNIIGNNYNVADFVPNMTFRAFVNFVANLFNLDVDDEGSVVYLNYIEDLLPHIIYKDHSSLEIPAPTREVDDEKVFALKYEDGSVIYVNKHGVLPSANAEQIKDIVIIDMPAIPLNVETFNERKTAVNTTSNTTVKLVLYNGLVDSEPLAAEHINGRTLKINDIYLKWKAWLKFRTNSEVYEDSFFAPVTQNINISKGLIKYNKKHLIKEIQRKSVNKKYNKVTVKFESF